MTLSMFGDALDPVMPRRAMLGAIQRLRELAIEDVVDQRALAAATDSGHADERTEREGDIDVAQVVGARPTHHQLLRARGTAYQRQRDAPLATHELSGDTLGCVEHVLDGSRRHHQAAVLAGARADVHHPVAARIVSSSCSTTMSVLPMSRSAISVRISLWLSR